MSAARPLFHRKRKSICDLAMSQKCQEATYAPPQTAYLFDHFVGPDQQRSGKLNAERLGALQVDDEIEFDGPLDWEVGRRGPLQNLVYESRQPIKTMDKINSVFHQRAGLRLRPESNQWQSPLQCDASNLAGVGGDQGLLAGHERLSSPRRRWRNCSMEVSSRLHFYFPKRQSQRAGGVLHSRDSYRACGIGRIDENGEPDQRRNGFLDQFDPFGADLGPEKGQAGQIPARTSKTGHEPSVDRIARISHNRNGRSGFLSC